MILETVCVGVYAVNCYILAQDKDDQAIIIDPGDEPDKIKQVLAQHKLNPALIINTHAHIDHIGGNTAFDIDTYIHKDDLEFLADPNLNLSGLLAMPLRINSSYVHTLEDKQILELGKIKLQVLHTPGHTPGGISLWLKAPKSNIVFSGDTLFHQGIGRTDLPFASSRQIKRSIREKLFVLDDKTQVYPGHGLPTSIGYEKENNPFLCSSERLI
ncbi:MAG: MBL fold metallo-hydrolase [Candidatus Omnitrophota bacterium]|jgi:glyoxylase-like metal-dependent hydrolase (beta-lactamase superfamily II)